MIVAVSSDDFNLREKGKVCQIKDVDRMEIVKAIRYVDEVILEETGNRRSWMYRNMMLMFCYGR